MKVAHVVLSLDAGGLERVVLDLVREGRELGQEVAIVCLEKPGAMAPEAESLGISLTCVHKGLGLRMRAMGQVRGLFSQLRPDVVHTHQIGALFYAGPAARLAGVPVVVHTEHGKHYATRRQTRLLGRLASWHVSRFFCVSDDIAAAVTAHRVAPRRKVGVVRNGIDVDRFTSRDAGAEVRRSLGISPEARVVGTVGRLNEIKRQDRLIRAFARISKKQPLIHLILVGDGPLRSDLVRLAGELGVANRTHFTGFQSTPERFLGAMDVFALTSRSEGMPLAILEAWAANVPVVASNVGGVPELVRDGHTGLLFDPMDESALPAALEHLLADASLSRRVATAGRQLVGSEYSLRRMAETYNRHYLALLGATYEAEAEQVCRTPEQAR
jgi:sugar transferase (PEP-CTERM/EpsH1 system associated)